MKLLIDGYNLLHQSVGMPSDRSVAGALHDARMRLLDLLVQRVDRSLLSKTTIVFDAKEAPPGLPDRLTKYSIELVFARDWNSADELIQELIRQHPNPKQLTVVSSDHAIQRRGTARGCQVYDSDVWLDRLERESQRPNPVDPIDQEIESTKNRALDPNERDAWLNRFGFDDPDTRDDK